VSRVLVIGCGNALRRDDGLGIEAIERLRRRWTDAPGDVEFLTVPQLLPELAEPVAAAEEVIFVDARYGGTPGRVRCRALSGTASAPGVLGHHVDPEWILSLARAAYGRAPAGFVFSVDGATFAQGEALSAPVRRALPRLLSLLRTRIERVSACARTSRTAPRASRGTPGR